MATNIQKINIKCADNYVLSATVFMPESTVKGAVFIGPATGIKQRFYQAFAQYLAEHGYGVITFDNRGIGGSIANTVNKSDATLQCWGELDMPAVFSTLKAHFPDCRYHLIGHSAGGQLVGLMHNGAEINSMFNVASSSGNISNMTGLYKFQAYCFLNAFLPLTGAIFGHGKSQWVGMGEPLPRGVLKQWRQWCNGEGYVKTAFGRSIKSHLYHDLSLPSLWVHPTDDSIANYENVLDMIAVFPNIDAKVLTLSPSEYGLKEIGHMKFFSQKSKVLWPMALDWLNTH